MRYLPAESTLPARLGDGLGVENISERELLYKVLFDMRRDVNELKKIVLEGISSPHNSSQLLKDHPQLFDGMAPAGGNSAVVLDMGGREPEQLDADAEEVEDITHVTEEDSLSIEKKEKELIIRALRKNNDKRKHAAHDLGISERTLYRKIKQYGLED